MKRLLPFCYFVAIFLITFAGLADNAFSQSTLIHYWNFNTLAGPYIHPNIPSIVADYTVLTPADSAYLEYYLLPGTSPTWGSTNNAGGAQIDNVTPGDTTNLRQGAVSGLGLRCRNPTDSAELHWHIPSTGFKNLVVKFATQTSSTASGDSAQIYSYSVDGGKTWDSTGMTVNGAPGHTLDLTQGGNANTPYLNFVLVSITFGIDPSVNNNPNLILRIKCVGNTSKTSGNNRYDNFTVDGDPTSTQSSLVLIDDWNFNNLTQAYHVPNVPNINADYSALSTSSAYLQYYLIPGTSANYAGYIDNYPPTTTNWQGQIIDTFNARNGDPIGMTLRVRNPVDSVELRWHIPTTGYNGIVIKYGLESSSWANGDSVQVFSYSPDGGTTWENSNITVNGVTIDSLNVTQYPQFEGDSGWGLVTINLTDPAVNNNANLIFRIIAHGNASKTSGNLRYDNFTVEGMGASGGGGPKPGQITVLTPRYGNIFVPGQMDTLKFTTINTVGEDRAISISVDSGKNWTPVGTLANDSTFVATVPNIGTSQGLLRVTADTITGTSGTFIIYPITPANRLVHYWDFSNLPTTGYHNPGIPNIKADFSATPTPGLIEYVLEPGAPTNYAGYLDPVPGDTVNNRLNSPRIGGLRVRNPTDMMELRWALPTTNYSGITISYALQASSSTGPQVERFDYSLDGGTTWQTSGFTVNGLPIDSLNVLDTIYQQPSNFGLVKLDFTGVTGVNNNPNFVLRIKFGDTATGGTSGNNRFDNISVDAQNNIAGVDEPLQVDRQLNLAPNPAGDYLSFDNPFASPVAVSVMDMLGRQVLHSTEIAVSRAGIDISKLPAGSYYLHIQDVTNGAGQLAKFVKK